MPARSRPDDLYLTALRILFWIVFAGVAGFAFISVRPVVSRVFSVLTPFILGLTLAYVFHPIVAVIQHRLGLGRVTGILVVAAVLLVLIGGFFAVLVPILYTQIAVALEGLIQFFSTESVDDLFARFVRDEERRIQILDFIRSQIGDLQANLTSMLQDKSELIGPVATSSVGAVRGVAQAIFAVFGRVGGLVATFSLSVIVAFYFLVEMSKIPAVMRRMLPVSDRERLWEVMGKANLAVGGFLRGQLIACTGVGLLASAILFMIGLKQYAVLIGFMAGAVNFIPYLGPAVGAAPAILWALFSSQMDSMGDRGFHIALIIGGFAFIQAVDGFVFQPFIVGRQAALHPLTVMLSLVIGAQFGIAGMILAVPAACVAKVFFVEYYWKNTSDFLEEGSGAAGEAGSEAEPEADQSAGGS